MVTSDTHQTRVGNLKSDFDNPASDALGTELVGRRAIRGDGVAKARFSDDELADKPHITCNNVLRGYFLCEVKTREDAE